MKIQIIPCLQDNYSYLIIDEENNIACVVDPSEADRIIEYLENKKDIEILGNKVNDWWTQHKENLKETFLIIKNV